MMKDESPKDIYANMIAGRIPVGSGSAMKAVSNQAYAILGTNRLHAYILERQGYAYYFVVESQHLTSFPDFNIPFTKYIPGSDLFEGDAIYYLSYEGFAVAMIIEGGNMRILCNDEEILNDYLLALDLPTIEIDPYGGETMSSVPQAILGVSDKFGRLLNRTSISVLACSAATFIGLNVFEMLESTLKKETVNIQAIQDELNSTLNRLSVQQPLAMQLSRIQQVSATVVRSGGWIEKYSMGPDVKRESFEVVLPSWVSQDYIDQLGKEVVTDLRDMDGLLIVRKNIRK